MLAVKKLGDGAFRVQKAGKKCGMLSRYGILNETLSKSYAKCSLELTDGGVLMHGAKRDVEIRITEINNGGYRLDIPVTEKERFFGIGDATRDGIMLRGKTVGIWVCNVSSYGPLPLLLSSDGWAILINSTYRQKFDIADSDKDTVSIFVAEDAPDFYLFTAKTLKDTLSAVTDVTGKPTMLPNFGYGLTFVENEVVTGARELLDDVRQMRDRRIPCDVIGLEPSWMETYYDCSNNKKWDPKKFYLNYWLPENQAGEGTFLAPLRFMGMQLSLWLCEDYDFFYEEDRQEAKARGEVLSDGDEGESEQFKKNIDFLDYHLVGKVWDTKFTVIDEPWFEHLKKFVDNGAACFKLDGSYQVLEHPQRAWAEKYFDREAHNIYPLILAKQMYKGFREHTGRRGMIYSAGGYVGIQKYAATWAGDTGGGPRTLVSCMNYAMCGHTNTSCDMDIYNPMAIHYGFLQSWSQINSWASHKLPWYQEEHIQALIKYYSELRSSLFPYIYSTAHNAAVTGIPILRPLPLVYEETDRFDGVTNAYMLGDSMYVGAFDMNLKLPDGRWIDYFMGKEYSGDIKYDIPEGRGGALLVRAGSIIPTMEPQLFINECEHKYIIRVFPGSDSSFSLYEDDGFSFGYETGEYAETLFTLSDNGDKGCTLTVNMREGDFPGRPDNGHNIYNNSIPKIEPARPVSDMKICVHTNVGAVTLDGEAVDFTLTDGVCEFTMRAEQHSQRTLTYKIEY